MGLTLNWMDKMDIRMKKVKVYELKLRIAEITMLLAKGKQIYINGGERNYAEKTRLETEQSEVLFEYEKLRQEIFNETTKIKAKKKTTLEILTWLLQRRGLGELVTEAQSIYDSQETSA